MRVLPLLLLLSTAALAQGLPPYPRPRAQVSVVAPDGGMPVIVQGTVQTTPPDGGMRVTLGSDVVPVSGSVSATVVGTVPVSGTVSTNVLGTVPISGTVSANVVGTVPVSGTVAANVVGTVPVSGTVAATVSGSVLAYPPDGGMQITLAGERISVTNPVEVTGISGARVGVEGPVTATISGTPNVAVTNTPTVALQNGAQVSLTGASLATLTAATGKGICTYTNGQPTGQTVTTTASNIPASPLANRTAITIWNYEATRIMWCSAVGTAAGTSAVRVYPDGNWQKWEGLTTGMTISCRCATSTCEYGYQEERCYQ